MASILQKQNATVKVDQDNYGEDSNMEADYFNDALCKISNSLFVDQKSSYCSSHNNKFGQKM